MKKLSNQLDYEKFTPCKTTFDHDLSYLLLVALKSKLN